MLVGRLCCQLSVCYVCYLSAIEEDIAIEEDMSHRPPIRHGHDPTEGVNAMSITLGYTPHKTLLAWEKTAEVRTIPQLFERALKKNPDKMMLACKKDGRYQGYTYEEVADNVERLSYGLMTLGLSPEDRVAQVSSNRPEWVFADLGILSAGGIHVPIYPTLAASGIAYILRDARVQIVLVANVDQVQKVLGIADEVPDLRYVVCYDDGPGIPSDTGRLQVHKLTDLLEKGWARRSELADERRRRIGNLTASHVASLVYTSGTTGEPKGAMLMHGNFASNCSQVAPLMGLREDDIELSFLPLCHVFERIAYYALLYVGATIYYAESIEAVPANLVEVRPTIVPSVPRLFEKIHGRVMEGVEKGSPLKRRIFGWAMRVGRAVREHREAGMPVKLNLHLAEGIAHKLVFSKIHERTGGRLRIFISGGAPLRRDIAEFFADIGITICEGYGLTETSPVITFNRPDNVRFGSVGQPVPGVEVKIADDGEILTRGPHVMLGYFNKPEDTRAAIDADGWFHTGDIGALDEEQFLRITDRKKELLVMSNGKNVAPQPIENLLKSSNYIEQAVVIGDNRNFISALIVPNFPVLETWAKSHGITARDSQLAGERAVHEFLEKHVQDLCRDLSQYEKVKKIALLENELTQEAGEMTPTLKYKRRVILEKYKDKIEAMYAG